MGNFDNGFPPRSDSAPYSGPIGRGVPPRPSTAQGMHGAPLPRGYPANGGGPGPYGEPEAQRPVSINEFYDSYYDPRVSNEYPPNDPGPASFDNAPGRARGDSLEQHMRQPPPPRQEQAQRGPGRVPEMNRTKSQPDLREPQTAVFEMASDMPPMPAQYQQQGGNRPGPPVMYPGPGAGAGANMRQAGPPPQNPDALPSHPVPVRPGLMKDSMVNLNSKPPPVRNYSAGGPVPQPVISPPQGRQQPLPPMNGAPAGSEPELPVTNEELDRLRAVVKADPLDQQTALRFAKRSVEAADVLVPMLPDPKTRARARERYVLDAQKVLKKLTSANNADAMFFFADCLGRGVFGNEPDQKEAFTLYQSAAKLGHAGAAYRTAVCCEIGNEEGGGTRKDPLKAIQWYKRASLLGDTPAMYKMGIIMLKGLLGQPKNPREAVGWLKRAAENADSDNPHALHELGLLYESAQPNDAILRDEAYAFRLFKQAAELGYKFSQFRLGAVFEYGLMGMNIDPRQSIFYYSKAAAQEEHQSELALSGWYLTGTEGVLAQSDTEAYLWARKAALAGLAKAEYAMGYFTEVGIGVPANLEDAKRWYWRAAAQEFPQARERLEDLKRNGRGGPRARERFSRSKIGKQQEGECSVM
jgi:TPR repeat protein